jgi:hypothetical protein
MLGSVFCYFPENTTCAVLFRDMVSINYKNVFRIVRAVFETITILFWGFISRASIFEPRMFILNGHHPMGDKLLITKYE